MQRVRFSTSFKMRISHFRFFSRRKLKTTSSNLMKISLWKRNSLSTLMSQRLLWKMSHLVFPKKTMIAICNLRKTRTRPRKARTETDISSRVLSLMSLIISFCKLFKIWIKAVMQENFKYTSSLNSPLKILNLLLSSILKKTSRVINSWVTRKESTLISFLLKKIQIILSMPPLIFFVLWNTLREV